MLTSLIMAGGIGERFWPLSTPKTPKQFLTVFSDKPLIIKTFDRINKLIPCENIFIGTNEIQAPIIKQFLKDIPERNIIIEPAFKDTASAIAYGVKYIERYFENPVVAVLASDHLIRDEDNFCSSIAQAEQLAEQNWVVTLGIKPNRPEIGYGYIEILNKAKLGDAQKAIRFREKPDLNTAIAYVNSGIFLWNSGMFIFKANKINELFKKHLPNHYKTMISITNLISKTNLIGSELSDLVRMEFEKFEKISIDFGIMEKTQDIMVIPVDFGWNDVGNFLAFDDIFDKNKNESVICNAKVVEVESKRNIVVSYNNRNIAIIGLEDIVVAETEEGLLICKKSELPKLKDVMKLIN